MRVRALGTLLLPTLLAALAACSAAADPTPDTDAAPTGPPCLPAASAGPSVTPPATNGPALPAMALQCFVGGRWTSLAELRGPTIVNLWASWCRPCRAELPALQRYADRAGSRVKVVGVVTKDDRDAAQSVVDELRLTFPMLEDRQQHLMLAVGRATGKPVSGLPVTLFIGADGRLAYVYNGPELDDATITALAARHLGVSA